MAKNAMMDAVRRLSVSNGDILLIKKDAATDEELKDLSLRLSRMGKDKVLILAMDDPSKLSALNETDMAKYGWFRAKNVIPLRHRPNNGESKDGTNQGEPLQGVRK